MLISSGLVEQNLATKRLIHNEEMVTKLQLFSLQKKFRKRLLFVLSVILYISGAPTLQFNWCLFSIYSEIYSLELVSIEI